MTAKKKITADLSVREIGAILASLQTSIGRIQETVRDQEGAQLLADIYSARDKILASLGTTYEAYETSWNSRTNEVVDERPLRTPVRGGKAL